MQGVADAVGLSVATVSRVLSNADFVRDDTRDRVIEAAARLGYSQSRRSKAHHPGYLKNENHLQDTDLKHILLLSPERVLRSMEVRENWIYYNVVPTLHRLAREKGFHLTLSSYARGDQWNPAALEGKHVDGVLWMGQEEPELLSEISKTVPVVVLNDDSAWPPQTCVVANNRAVIFKAVEHLVNLGHRRIGFFSVEGTNDSHTRERLNAYQEAVNHFNLAPDMILYEQFGHNEHPEAIARATDRMLALKTRPTAMIFPLRYSIQFLKELHQRRLAVPEEMSLVAIDNAAAAEMIEPPLTAVDCLFGYCAEVAVELLMDETKRIQNHRQILLQEPELIVRKSTAPPPME